MDEEQPQPSQQTPQGQNVPPTPDQPSPVQPAPTGGKGYGKRPLWQWIIIYLVVAAVLYFLVYWLFLRGDSVVY